MGGGDFFVGEGGRISGQAWPGGFRQGRLWEAEILAEGRGDFRWRRNRRFGRWGFGLRR